MPNGATTMAIVSSKAIASILASATDVKLSRKVTDEDGGKYTVKCAHEKWQTNTVEGFATATKATIQEKRDDGETTESAAIPVSKAALLVRLSMGQGEEDEAPRRNGRKPRAELETALNETGN